VELDAATVSGLRFCRLTMHANRVSHVTTISRVAKDIGDNEDWLFDVANEMDVEDGAIWVFEVDDEGMLAFTDLGIKNLIDPIKVHKGDPTLLRRRDGDK
jgi:hypothetical protein